MLTPEDLQQIVAAYLATPQAKWVSQKMQEEGVSATGDNPVPANPTPAAPAAPPVDPAAPAGAPPAADPAGPDSLEDLNDLLDDDDAGPPPAADEPPKKPEKNAMAYSATNDPGVTVEKYAALEASHNKLVQEHGRLWSEVASLKQAAVDGRRTVRVHQLAADYPVVNREEELKATLYSLGANLTDEQFDQHIATVEKYAQRTVQAVSIPTGDAPRTQSEVEKEQYAQKLSETAVRLHTRAVDAGKPMTWDEAKAAAAQQLKS